MSIGKLSYIIMVVNVLNKGQVNFSMNVYRVTELYYFLLHK
jgi:hypothetical protein